MERRAIGPAVVRGDAEDQRGGVFFGNLDDDVEVAALIEDAGVDQLELGIVRAAAAIFVNQLTVGKRSLRVLVEQPLVGMTRYRVEIEVALFDVLAVIGLAGHQAEVTFLENRILLVPERQRPAEDLVAIAETGDAVLSPSKGLRAREIVREIRPGIAVRAVVLAHRSPGAVGEIWPPLAPVGDVVGKPRESGSLRGHGCWRLNAQC